MNNAMLVPKSYVTYVSMCRDKVVEEVGYTLIVAARTCNVVNYHAKEVVLVCTRTIVEVIIAAKLMRRRRWATNSSGLFRSLTWSMTD